MLDFFLHIKRIYYKLLFDHRICQMKVKKKILLTLITQKKRNFLTNMLYFKTNNVLLKLSVGLKKLLMNLSVCRELRR